MAVFPTISRGSVCLFPVTRSVSAGCDRIQFADDSEARWSTGVAMDAWSLSYPALTWADVQTIETFFNSVKGSYDNTWQFPFLGTTYSAMVFQDDSLTYQRAQNNRYSLSLRFRATKRTQTPGSLGSFPSTLQTPFVSSTNFQTLANDMPAGHRYAYWNRSDGRKQYTLNFPLINETELGALMTHFVNARGPWRAFSFTDPNTSSSKTVRYVNDVMNVQYIALRNCTTSIQLEEVAA